MGNIMTRSMVSRWGLHQALSLLTFLCHFEESWLTNNQFRPSIWFRYVDDTRDAFYIGKTKRRLHDRKTEHLKALTQIGLASAVAEHSISTSHNIKWDHFEILASGQCDLQCKIKETLLKIRHLKPALNENVGSENIRFFINLHRMQFLFFHCCLASYQYLA